MNALQIAVQLFAVIAGKPNFQRRINQRQFGIPARHEFIDVGIGLQIDHHPIHLRRLVGHGELLQRLDRQIQRLNVRRQNLRLLHNADNREFQLLAGPRQREAVADVDR